MKRALFAASAAALLFAAPAGALTRDEVISRAKGFAYHPWTATTANLTASCNTKYRSLYVAGDHVGVAYDWGGYMSLFEFDKEIAQGLGAGSLETDGILACTAGLDCSGFVSQVWGVGHFTTSTMDQASAQIAQAQILPGDVFNQAGYHVAMFTTSLANGEPSLVEALGYNVHVNTTGGWSHVSGYVPRRGNTVTGTTAGNPLGTLVNPIAVSTFPFTDQRDTRQSMSDMLDGCGAAPTINQTGPEYVYALTITQPGTITATVADDATADIDLQLLTSLNTQACVTRGDTTISRAIGCGTYYLVADTFGSSAGQYTLNVTFAPSGQACGAVAGPPAFDPRGKLGEACAFPGDPSLPQCNANLGGDVCIYTQTKSFCSHPCAKDADCKDLPGGGCCEDISGKGELYCVTQSMCAAAAGPDAGGGGGGGSGGGAAGEGSGDPAADPGSGAASGAGGGASGGGSGGGCAIGSASSTGAGAFVAALVAIAVAARRRRR